MTVKGMSEVQQVRSRSIQDRIQIPAEEWGMENSKNGGNLSQWPKGSRTYLPSGFLHVDQKRVSEICQWKKYLP
jgi:hypothetical protein